MLTIIAGLISGIVSGTGMGGGTVLILFLSLFMGIEQHVAQATNLVFFIPTSIVAIWVSIKNKLVCFKVAIPVIITGIIGAIIGATISIKLEVENLKKYFGYFLAIIAIHEIYSLLKKYIISKKRNNNNKINEKGGENI